MIEMHFIDTELKKGSLLLPFRTGLVSTQVDIQPFATHSSLGQTNYTPNCEELCALYAIAISLCAKPESIYDDEGFSLSVWSAVKTEPAVNEKRMRTPLILH